VASAEAANRLADRATRLPVKDLSRFSVAAL